jgi:hypothetical protein
MTIAVSIVIIEPPLGEVDDLLLGAVESGESGGALRADITRGRGVVSGYHLLI